MNARHRLKAKEKNQIIKYKEKLLEKFLFVFALGLFLCLLTFLDIFLSSMYASEMHDIHFWIFISGASIASVLQIMQWSRVRIAKWLIWLKRWAFLGALGTGLVLLHGVLGRITFNWFAPISRFMNFGNEIIALKWCFAYIGIGIAVSFLLYLIKNYIAYRELKGWKKK